MAKLFAWEQVQTLWTKIKNSFVAKDAKGDVHVTNDLRVDGATSFENGAYSYGNVEINDGHLLKFYSEDASKSATMWCNDDGNLVLGGKSIATTDDVTSAVANAGHLKREKVTALPGVATAKDNVIYMLPVSGATGEDTFDEYMLIDGKLEKIGSSRIDLSAYSTTEQMNSAISTAVSNSYTLITDAEINGLT